VEPDPLNPKKKGNFEEFIPRVLHVVLEKLACFSKKEISFYSVVSPIA
jgi:hypothetical protein